jgi:hypothetical protein
MRFWRPMDKGFQPIPSLISCRCQPMRDLGFVAQQSPGSAVTFIKTGGWDRIIFHKLHPVTKIDQCMLQAYGRRTACWFSWSREIFVEASAS